MATHAEFFKLWKRDKYLTSIQEQPTHQIKGKTKGATSTSRRLARMAICYAKKK